MEECDALHDRRLSVLPDYRRAPRGAEEHEGFTLTKIDVTMRPDLLTAKKIKAVPVVEVGTVLRTGNLTSQELADLIGGAAVAVAGG